MSDKLQLEDMVEAFLRKKYPEDNDPGETAYHICDIFHQWVADNGEKDD